MNVTHPGFWSSETLCIRLPQLINPFASKRISHAAYELALGGEAYVTGEKARTLMSDGDEVAIPPGQFAVLITEERVTIPDDAIAFISMKSENKYRGLINVSGFHVDPGFSGRLLFSVFNAGAQEIHLRKGIPLFMIWYCSLDRVTEDVYKGKHNGQLQIPDKIVTDMAVKQYTPSSLGKEIEDAKTEFSNQLADTRKDIAVWKTLCLTLLGALIVNMVIQRPSSSSPPIIITPPPATTAPLAQPSIPNSHQPPMNHPTSTQQQVPTPQSIAPAEPSGAQGTNKP